jgi:hypothetical protein
MNCREGRTLLFNSHAVTDLNAQQSTRSSNIELVFYGLLIVAAGSTGVLFEASQVSRVLAVRTMIFGVAVMVTGWRALSRQQRTHSNSVNSFASVCLH